MKTLVVLAGLMALAILALRWRRSPVYADWAKLAKLYQTRLKPPANLATMQSGKVGQLLYNGTLNLAPTTKGLYLSTFSLLRWQAPPLLIPWADITSVEKLDRLYFQSYRLTVGAVAIALDLPCKPLSAAQPLLEPNRLEPKSAPQITLDSTEFSAAIALPLKRLTTDLMAQVAAQAQSHPRLRQNYNFHDPAERVQRFLNVMQPGTYVRPHCHHQLAGANRFEFFLVLQGALGLVVLDQQGQVLQTEQLNAQGPTQGLELAAETYHTLVALTPNTVMFELKEGPYDAQTDKEFLPMFPLEGTPAARQWVEKWEQYFK